MDGLANAAGVLGNRVSTNIKSSFKDMTTESWIRLVIIVGAYMLLRPYLIKFVSRNQLAQHEAENARAEEEAARKAAAKMSPNDLRGGPRIEVPEDTDSEGEGGYDAADASGPSWGKKARRRQRAMIRKLLEAEEKRLRETKEEEEDKDIEEFLIKE